MKVSEQTGCNFNSAYTGLRTDILDLIDFQPKTVLDVGCATGKMGAFFQQKYGSIVTGIEYDPAMALQAENHLEKVWQGDLNQTDLLSFAHPHLYDLILFGDVLEHLIDPWLILKQASSLLSAKGKVVLSVPNIGHYTTLVDLILFRRWPYRKRGIHDSTHLRFFTHKNTLEMIDQAGLLSIKEKRNLRVRESSCPFDCLASLMDYWPFRSFLTFQYLHLVSKKNQE